MSRALMIAVLAASVAAGMILARLLLPPERPPTDIAAEMRERVTESAGGDFSLPDLAGETRTLADWPQKLRIVNFWATWCAPCRREIPLLKDIQAEHGDAGLQVIGIAVDDPGPVADYAAEMGFNYPVLIGQADAIAAAESFGIDFLGLPFTLIVTPEGELMNVHVGEFDAAQADAMVQVLLGYLDGSVPYGEAKQALADI